MIDHLLTFPTELDARTALAPLGFWNAEAGVWDTSRTRSVKLILSRDPEVVEPGWHIVVTLPRASAVVRDLAGQVCRMLTDSSRANRLSKFHEYAVSGGTLTEGIATNTRLSIITRNGLSQIEKVALQADPIWVGTDYPIL